MLQASNDNAFPGRRFALCIGIGTYTHLLNRNLRFAVNDANAIAERLADPQRGNFVTTLCIEPTQTTKAALDEAMEKLLSASDRQADDQIVIYFSCHGDVYYVDNTFCLLPSDATQKNDGMFEPTTVISIHDFARWFSKARTQNIVVLLDVCHSGGAGAALQHFKLDLSAGPNFFIIGAARLDQVTRQSSQLQHGLFTHCLLRAFEQSPTQDGWLTVSQIHNFISEEIRWFAKDDPAPIQSWSVSVNPNLPLLRNPCYPELCPLPPLWNVPLQRNSFFTGQEDVLSRLARVLQSEQKSALTQPYALNGLGGIGKTQVALEYAYRHRQDYHAILWGHADTREALISTFVSIAHLLDLPQKDEKDLMVIVEAVKTWLAGRSLWLLILDNADELGIIKEFIPPAFRGHLLLTTRAQATGALAHKIEVEAMKPEVGALLLLRRASLIAPDALLEHASPADVTVAQELSEGMGGLPLALDQAGAYIEEVSCTLQDYRQLFHARRAELLKERGGITPDHPESVTITFSLSFEKVKSRTPTAIDLLRLCVFLHPDAIPEEIFTKGAMYLGSQLQTTASDPLALNKAIRALLAYSLLSRDSTSHTLTIHRLVQAVLQDTIPVSEQETWIQQAIAAMNAIFPAERYTTWNQSERLVSHVLTCETHTQSWKTPGVYLASLLSKTAIYLTDRAQYLEAEPLYMRTLRIAEQAYGPEHPQVGAVLHNLACFYFEQGQYEQAERFHKQALGIWEQAPEPQMAFDLHGLAEVYRAQGQYEQAEVLYTQALSIWEQTLDSEHLQLAHPLQGLADLSFQQGEYAQAEALYTRALRIREQNLGAMHPLIAFLLNDLAHVYSEQEKNTQAEALYTRALQIWEPSLGSEHPQLAYSLTGLADLYFKQDKYDQAEQLYKRAIQIREQALGSVHPLLASALNGLAILLHNQGKYEQAESLYLRTSYILERSFGIQHPKTQATQKAYVLFLAEKKVIASYGQDTARGLTDLAHAYYEKGAYELAKPLYKRALLLREQLSGTTHPETATSLINLATLYQKQKKYTEAEPLYQRALAIYEHVLGREHPHTATCLNNLAALYYEQKKYTEAELLCQRALAIDEHVLGREHPDIAPGLNNLAALYYDQKKYMEAEPLYQRALAVLERHLGSYHSMAMTCHYNLINLYSAQGKYAAVESLYLHSLSLYKSTLGTKHPSTENLRQSYASFLRKRGRDKDAERLREDD